MVYTSNTSVSTKNVYISTSKISPNQFTYPHLTTSFTIHLDEPIMCNSGEHIAVMLQSASIPNTYYHLKESTFVFKLGKDIGGEDVHSVTIPAGNYSIKQVYNAILIKMAELGHSCLRFDYISSQNKTKITFSKHGNETHVVLDFEKSTIARVLGFDSENITLYDTQSATSQNMVRLFEYYSIYVRTNLGSNSYNEKGHKNDIIQSIPLADSNSVTYFLAGMSQNKTLLDKKIISDFLVYLTFPDDALVDLNGYNLELCFSFSVIQGLDRGLEFEDLRASEEPNP